MTNAPVFSTLKSPHIPNVLTISLSVNDLVSVVLAAAGKKIKVRHVKGPVGVQSRNFSNERMYSIGWLAKVPLKEGIAQTYPWIRDQVLAARGASHKDKKQG